MLESNDQGQFGQAARAGHRQAVKVRPAKDAGTQGNGGATRADRGAQDDWDSGSKTAAGPLTSAQSSHGAGAEVAGRTKVGGEHSKTMERRIAINEHPENDAWSEEAQAGSSMV